MMSGRGGYQRPAKPAAVSGPGKMSQRTDGGPSVDNPTQAAKYVSGMPYGEGGALNEVANSAPLAAAGGVPSGPSVTRLNAPTERPDEPITAGIPLGAGPGPEVLPPKPSDNDLLAAVIRQAYAANPSTYLRNLLDQLEAQGR